MTLRRRYSIPLVVMLLVVAVLLWWRPVFRLFVPPAGDHVVLEVDGERYPTARGSYCYNGLIPGTGSCSDYAGFPAPSYEPLVVGPGETARIMFPHGEPRSWSASNLHVLPAPSFGRTCTSPPCNLSPGGRSDVVAGWTGANEAGTLTWPQEPGSYGLLISAQWSGGQVSYGIWVMIPDA